MFEETIILLFAFCEYYMWEGGKSKEGRWGKDNFSQLVHISLLVMLYFNVNKLSLNTRYYLSHLNEYKIIFLFFTFYSILLLPKTTAYWCVCFVLVDYKETSVKAKKVYKADFGHQARSQWLSNFLFKSWTLC